MTTHIPIPVVVETPYAGEVPLHLRYVRACMRDCLLRGEAPFASHHQYTAPGVLRDEIPAERQQGIRAGFAWRGFAHKTVFYVDYGWSMGMQLARVAAAQIEQPFEVRLLGPTWLEDQVARESHGDALAHWLQSLGPPS